MKSYEYELLPGDTAVYRGRQWIVVANNTTDTGAREHGGGFILHNNFDWFYADQLGRGPNNWDGSGVSYSMFSHLAHKGGDLDDLEAVYRIACSYFDVDTRGWLNAEIAHTREAVRIRAEKKAIRAELFAPGVRFRPRGRAESLAEWAAVDAEYNRRTGSIEELLDETEDAAVEAEYQRRNLLEEVK
jgi:hypothetical protein